MTFQMYTNGSNATSALSALKIHDAMVRYL